MTLTLISLDFNAPVSETTVGKLPCIIGHSPDADLRIEHSSISREHCRIDCVDGKFVVYDLESVHGTFVDGTRVREAELQPGSQLAIGLLSFLVQVLQATDPLDPAEETLLTVAM